MVAVKTKGVATGFELFKPGLYQATLKKYTEGKAGAGAKYPGSPTFKAEWLITSPEESAGRSAFINGSLRDDAAFSIKRIGVALGVSDDILEDEEGWDPTEILPEYYGENEVTLVITMGKPYNGKDTNNVDVLLENEKASSSEEGAGSWS